MIGVYLADVYEFIFRGCCGYCCSTPEDELVYVGEINTDHPIERIILFEGSDYDLIWFRPAFKLLVDCSY